jgi:purine-binding chemotaxis protein CheW
MTDINETGGQETLAQAGKYLTFRLNDETFGIEILKVQEIIGVMPITRMPKLPAFVRGVINLRGRVIPLTDLRRRFDMAAAEDTPRTCFIVVQVDGAEGRRTCSIVVDEVCEVQEVAADQIEEAPAFGSAVDTEFIAGMGKISDTVAILLNIDCVLNTQMAAAAG